MEPQGGSQAGSDSNGEPRSNAAGQPAPTPTHVTHRSSTELQADAGGGVSFKTSPRNLASLLRHLRGLNLPAGPIRVP